MKQSNKIQSKHLITELSNNKKINNFTIPSSENKVNVVKKKESDDKNADQNNEDDSDDL